MKNYREMAQIVLERRDRYASERRKQMNLLKKTGLSVACCCAVALLGIGVWKMQTPAVSPPVVEDVAGPITTLDAAVTEALADKLASGEATPEYTTTTEPEQNPDMQIERPADRPTGVTEDVFQAYPNLKDLSDLGRKLYGGCYINGDRLTLVITEDRPENRQLLCEQLGIGQTNLDFVTGKYSLAYLTWLQEEITARMMDGSFPFVVGSGVYEMQNRVGITVTTEDPTLIDQVLALDTMGGAIMTKYGAAPSIDLPLATLGG